MLLSEVESKTSISFDQNYFVVLPTIPIEGLQEYYSSYPLVDVKSFSSQQDLLAKHEVKQMLLKEGFAMKKCEPFNNWCKWFTGRHACHYFRAGLSCNSYVSKSCT